MSERADAEPQNEIERVIAEMGLPNLQVILACYRRFLDAVDYRKVMAWQITQPLDDLLQPLFLKAVATISRDLELGDAARALAQAEEGGWEWAVRRNGPHGSSIHAVPDEEDARDWASVEPNADLGYTNTLVRRRIGPWTEVPADAAD